MAGTGKIERKATVVDGDITDTFHEDYFITIRYELGNLIFQYHQ